MALWRSGGATGQRKILWLALALLLLLLRHHSTCGGGGCTERSYTFVDCEFSSPLRPSSLFHSENGIASPSLHEEDKFLDQSPNKRGREHDEADLDVGRQETGGASQVASSRQRRDRRPQRSATYMKVSGGGGMVGLVGYWLVRVFDVVTWAHRFRLANM